MLTHKLLSVCGGESKLYVDDVFSAYTYTSNDTTQTINNGIDLAGNGGMVWRKQRTNNSSGNSMRVRHLLADSARPLNTSLATDGAEQQFNVISVSSFNSNGYTLGSSAAVTLAGDLNVSWTFRRSLKFFDVVTFTAGTSINRRISHSLGIAPGMIILKSTTSSQSWIVYHSTSPRI